jgi:hypothetical protein
MLNGIMGVSKVHESFDDRQLGSQEQGSSSSVLPGSLSHTPLEYTASAAAQLGAIDPATQATNMAQVSSHEI